MKITFHITLLLVIVSLMVACNGRSAKKVSPTESHASSAGSTFSFSMPDVPPMLIDPSQRMIYVLEHYWDAYPFGDTTAIRHSEYIERRFSEYASLLQSQEFIPYETADRSIRAFLEKASSEYAVYAYFSDLFRKYFYDANSPVMNDEYYLPVLAHRKDCAILTETQRHTAAAEYRVVSRNRPGSVASDFVYTLANGQQSRLSAIQSPYTILLFNNPGCHACEEVFAQIQASALINNLSARGQLKLLAVYPDEDLVEWHKYQSHIPASWINAYDKELSIRNKELYDLKAIPMLFLLNADKTVILKDARVAQVESFFQTAF